MTALRPDESLAVDAEAVFSDWLKRYGSALEASDPKAVTETFVEDGYWKDVLAFTWGYRTYSGVEEIAWALEATVSDVKPMAVRPATDRTPPRLARRSGRQVIEGFFDFDTRVGRGAGFARLLLDESDPLASQAWIVLTTLQELTGSEERIGQRRPTGVEYSTNFAGENWLDRRRNEQSYANCDPDVLIVGGGQAGLVLAARLRHTGVDALIVEKLPRVGDNWRNRYHSLTLHNEVWANHLPYMPFPETWPTFVPKDKLASWLEAYAEAMELNVWLSTTFLGGEYDEDAKRWDVRVRRPDGSERSMQVRHLVLATGGVSGVPHMPALPGLQEFDGEVIHSSQFASGAEYDGKHAIVVGTGNSGHDVAQDLYANGASVTMVQRSPTCVVSLVPSGTLVYSLYSEGPPADDIDLITAALPYPLLRESYQWLTQRTCELDADLLGGLHAAGFETDFGDDGTGFHMMYLRRGGGYYINVGCSDLIASRQVGLVQSRDTERFTADGLLCLDGTLVEADLIVLATGYENQQEGVRRLLGDEVADKLGPIWGFDDNYVMRNMWQRTQQEGLWIMGGSLVDCRLYSRFLSLLIAADLTGLASDERL